MRARRRTSRGATALVAGASILLWSAWTGAALGQAPDVPVPTPVSTPAANLDLPVDLPAGDALPDTGEVGSTVEDTLGGDTPGTTKPRSSYKEWTRTGAPQGGATTDADSTRAGGDADGRSARTAPGEDAPGSYAGATAGSIVDTFRRAVSLGGQVALPLGLSAVALVLLVVAARGPGRMAKVEEDAEANGVWRL